MRPMPEDVKSLIDRATIASKDTVTKKKIKTIAKKVFINCHLPEKDESFLKELLKVRGL
jgi:hypothetical protein